MALTLVRTLILLAAVCAYTAQSSAATMPYRMLLLPSDFDSVVETPSTADDPKETARKRKHQVDQILTSARPALVADQRWVCLNGQQPSEVRGARSEGLEFVPDAADSCLAALQRKGKDHALLEAYKKLAVSLDGNLNTYENLPNAIGAAVLSGDGKISVGNGKGIKVDPALALDSGFTAAFVSGAAKKEGLDQQKLKVAAESCLDQKNEAATCFSVGYMLGAQAFNAQ